MMNKHQDSGTTCDQILYVFKCPQTNTPLVIRFFMCSNAPQTNAPLVIKFFTRSNTPQRNTPLVIKFFMCSNAPQRKRVCSPNAPPISAPLVGMLTFTIPQSDPFGLQHKQAKQTIQEADQKNKAHQKIKNKADSSPCPKIPTKICF